MAFGSKYAVGLDIGSSSVKAVQMRKAGRGYAVDKIGVADIYPGGDKSAGAGRERALTIQAIRNALDAGKIKAKQAITSLSGESIIVRYFQMPAMPEEELKNAVRWSAEEYIPYSIEEVNIDAAILGESTSEAGAEVDVLLVSAKNDLVNEHVSIVNEAGLTPIVVDLASFAFVNCYEINYQPSSEDVCALVNIGASITNINIYQGMTSRFSRDIAIAGDNVTAALQSRLGLEFAEAEQLKIAVGLPGDEAAGSEGSDEAEGSLVDTIRGRVDKLTSEELEEESTEAVAGRTIRNSLNNVINEVRRSIQFFENQPKGKPVQKIILGGGSSSLKGLAEYFQQQITLPVEIIDPFNRVTPSGRDVDTALFGKNKEVFAVGIGLALRKVVD
jgi:type IV pilus assembly protein PilM